MDILDSSEWQNKRIQFVIRESHCVENVGAELQERSQRKANNLYFPFVNTNHMKQTIQQ